MAFSFSTRSLRNLIGVHPDLVQIMHESLECVPYDFIVTEGVRAYSRQVQLVKEGKSKTYNSYHLRQPDGYGHAVDVCLILPDNSITWEPRYYLKDADIILELARKRRVRLTWGGDFGTRRHGQGWDCPHFEIHT